MVELAAEQLGVAASGLDGAAGLVRLRLAHPTLDRRIHGGGAGSFEGSASQFVVSCRCVGFALADGARSGYRQGPAP
jgi:hypothetical protein